MALTCNIFKYLIFFLIVGLIALHPAPGSGQDQKADNVSEEARTATASRKEPPLLVRNIYVKFEPVGHEKVFIDFSREAAPEISSIGGKDPRIVVDIKNVLSIRQGIKKIEVKGKLIRQVRSNLDLASRRLRIVVDLAPSRNYEVEPVFYKAEKIYVLNISEAPVDQKKGSSD
jgi:hypothetical protein